MTVRHWDSIYGLTAPDEVPWWEPVPSTLSLVLAYAKVDDPIIDVGGGTSTLAIELVRRGYRDVTVLDISERALGASKAALCQHTDVTHHVHADITEFQPDRRYRLWHDRAVFHFLTDLADRDAYRAAAGAAVVPGGVMVVSTFGPDGPDHCAGLPVCRYDVGELAAEFVPDFELIDGHPLTPPSSAGDQRPYVAVALRRRGV